MDEDYGCFAEPSEADLVIDEAKEKLYDLLKDEIKKTIEEANEAKKKLDRLKSDVYTEEYKLSYIKSQQEQEKKKLDELKADHLPREFIRRLVTKYTGDICPGDIVYVIREDHKQRTCPMCGGTQKVNADIDGIPYMVKCPECDGRGYLYDITRYIKEKIVDEVRMKLCFEADRVGIWSQDTISLRGQDWNTAPDSLYRSREEAEAALGARNKTDEEEA